MRTELHEPNKKRRVVGIDFGLARIGIAVSDETATLATPHSTLHEKDKGAQTRRIADFIAQVNAAAVVVGIPFELDGANGVMAQTAEKFALKLETLVDVPIYRWDERFSSVEAKRALDSAATGKRRKKKALKPGDLDKAAAAILLQEWLDQPRRPALGSPGVSEESASEPASKSTSKSAQ